MEHKHAIPSSGSVLQSCTRNPSPIDCFAVHLFKVLVTVNLVTSLYYNIPAGLSVGIETFGHNVVYSAEKENI